MRAHMYAHVVAISCDNVFRSVFKQIITNNMLIKSSVSQMANNVQRYGRLHASICVPTQRKTKTQKFQKLQKFHIIHAAGR